ncbi:MAG TPA: amidohydrolase family protein [Bryobacterales bacterium]|nr:amidohydrolase family protein [Bryobacterales bacterium]
MIWDLHNHLDNLPGRTPEERMAALMRFADRMGIDRLMLYMGYPFVNDPTPEQLREQNDQVLQALSHYHDRACGFVYLSPNHLAFSLQEFDRCVRDGPMVGVKLWTAKRASAPALDPIVDRAAALRALIFQHTWLKVNGNLPGESTPLDVAALARRHPSIPLICGHTGGDWERGIRVIRGLPNVYADTAGSDPTSGFVEMAVRELGPERVIYGSDVAGRSYASQLAKVAGAQVPDAARRLILGENLRRLLTPILQAKGIRL